MPHIIINDKLDPVRYYIGAGFGEGQTTENRDHALVFAKITEACKPLDRRADLYAIGWRVVPADR